MWFSRAFWRYFVEAMILVSVQIWISVFFQPRLHPFWYYSLTACSIVLICLWLARRAVIPLFRLASNAKALVSARTINLPMGLVSDEVVALESALALLSQDQRLLVSQIDRDREQSQAVLRCMAEGVIVFDGEENITFMNEAARQLLKVREPIVLGRKIWEMVRHRGLADLVEKSINQIQPISDEFTLKLPEERVVQVRGTSLIGAPNRGSVLVLLDMTLQRRLERTRQEFFADVSHELKTPISTIRAMVETLLDGALDDPEHNTKFLQRIQEGALRLDRLAADLLTINRIETGQRQLQLITIPLDQSLQRCLERHEKQALARRLTLSIARNDRGVMIWADEMALDQVLDNLVENAIKYNTSGGSITLSASEDRHQGLIEVIDTGMGIDRSDIGRIFERFYRVDTARSIEAGGSGLGLSIVKHLVLAQNGKIEVESELGKGSKFRIWMPLAQ